MFIALILITTTLSLLAYAYLYPNPLSSLLASPRAFNPYPVFQTGLPYPTSYSVLGFDPGFSKRYPYLVHPTPTFYLKTPLKNHPNRTLHNESGLLERPTPKIFYIKSTIRVF